MRSCSAVPELTPTPPTISPSTCTGRPPPMMLKWPPLVMWMPNVGLPGTHSWLYTCVPLRAIAPVAALSIAIEMLLTLPPFMRSNLIRCPDSSVTAMHIGMPSSRAFAAAPSIRICASSVSSRLSVSMLDQPFCEHGSLEVSGQRRGFCVVERYVGRIQAAHRHADQAHRGFHRCRQAAVH